MPIEHGLTIRQVSKAEYHEVDYEVMRLAFAVHNEFGRLHDEHIYENDLRVRCKQAGLDAKAQVPICVRYEEFTKTYWLDLIINNSVVYELKTVDAIASRHRGQLLHYLMLVELAHGKLVNFRPTSVEHEFMTTGLTRIRRAHFTIDKTNWLGCGEKCDWFRQLMEELLLEWGAFLDIGLFRDAVIFFLGGEEIAHVPVEVVRNGHSLGHQKVHLLTSGTAFEITAMSEGIDSYERHLSRFLGHTRLACIQWVNFNHHELTFRTVVNSSQYETLS